MKSSSKKLISLLLSLLLLCTVAIVPTVAADESEAAPLKILAIGNSYSNNATEYISAIAESMGLDVTAASLYQPGCPLKRHVEYYEAYETLGHDAYYASENKSKYEFLYVNGVANRNILSIQEAIAYTDWDYITIQQMPDYCDDITSYYTEENPYITKLYGYIQDELAENSNTKCEILFHQGWSFSHAMSIDNAYNYYPVDYDNTKDFFEAIESTVNEATEILKDKCGLEKAPEIVLAGKAVQLAKDEFGFADSWGEETSLYADSISHLSPLGKYLVACVWIETFAAKADLSVTDTRTATYIPAGVTAEMAKLLRSCAHEAVTGEADTVYGDWRAVPYGDGLKITHFVGEAPATGTVTVPALLGEKSVLCIGKTTFKYVEGVTAVLTESNSAIVEDGAYDGLRVVPTFWDGTSVESTVGSGEENDPYIITNAAQLHWAVGTMVGTTYKDKYYKLANDIYINDITVDVETGTVTGAETAKQWFPDGTSNIFYGHIDGDNHVVYGLYVNKDYTGDTVDWQVGRGLIPRGAGTVKNLGIENAYVKAAKTAVSAFIGTNNNASVPIGFENCYVGEDVYLSGSCVGGFWAGGAGDSATNIGFENCYCLATISATSANFWGALTGQVWTAGSIPVINCYTNTRLYGQSPLKFTNCYSIGEKAAQSGVTTLTAEKMKGVNAGANMALGAAYVVTDGYPILRSFSSRTNGEWSGFRYASMAGSGTEKDPWLVATAENLAYIAAGGAVAGKYYKLTNDIYLNDIKKIDFSTGAVEDGYYAEQWMTNNAAFNATLDGNGHTVYGVWYPVGVVDSGNNSTGYGLFCKLGAGSTIKNLAVSHSYFDAAGYVGAIVGLITDAGQQKTVDSCYVDSTVTVVARKTTGATTGVGAAGIVCGLLNAANVKVSNCVTFATLRSQNSLKHIVANIWKSNNNTVIDSCYALGALVGGDGDNNRITAVTNSYSPDAPNETYYPWTQISATAMTGAKALDRMPHLADGFTAVAKDYPVPNVFAQSTEELDKSFWDGAYVKPTKGSGTESDPYLITTDEEFAYVIYNGGTADTYYKLTTDIYLNRTDKIDWANGALLDENYPVNEWFTGRTTGGNTYYNGINDIAFSGTIDGDGHTVYGMYYTPGQPGTNSGLVPAVKNATIKNLALKDSFAASGRWTAAIVGCIYTNDNVLTVNNVLVDDSVKVLAYNSGNYYYDGSLKDDRINAKGPFTGTVANGVSFESCASGGIVGFVATRSTANISNCAVYAKFDGTSCNIQYANPYANGGKPYSVDKCGAIYGLMGTCWNPTALNFNNSITDTNPVNNGNAALGTPNFTMSGVYNAGEASTREGVTNVAVADITGANGLAAATALLSDVWYAVKADGAYPSLRVIGTTMGDVDEDGAFALASDSAALRTVILKAIAPSNGDTNKNGTVDICDLVALQLK